MAAQSKQVAAIGMDGRSAIIGRRRSSGAPRTPPRYMYMFCNTCNGKTKITVRKASRPSYDQFLT